MVEGGRKWSFDDGRGCGVKICVAGQVATAGLGTSARGSPKQMGGAATTYNFCKNARRSLRQQCQSCGGGSPALHVLRRSMRRISARQVQVLSPRAPISARHLRPPPGHTPAHSAEVQVLRRKKQTEPTGNPPVAFRPWLASWLGSGSPTTPPNQSTIRHRNQKPPSHMTE